jgi:hypothetical protein
MKTIATVYQRPLFTRGGAWLRDTPVEVTAEVEQFGDLLLVLWTPETMAALAELRFDGEELVGAQEAIEEAHHQAEREACRVASVKQRMGATEAA